MDRRVFDVSTSIFIKKIDGLAMGPLQFFHGSRLFINNGCPAGSMVRVRSKQSAVAEFVFLINGKAAYLTYAR